MATETVSAAPKSSLDSTFPVLVPEEPALFLSEYDFGKHINTLLSTWRSSTHSTGPEDALATVTLDEPAATEASSASEHFRKLTFMDALAGATATVKQAVALPVNKMYTENMGITNESTNSPLLDLFAELEETMEEDQLPKLLEPAWREDPLATLKIVWNARSIHLGKGEKNSFYRCLGWIKNEHPKTVLANLPWLVQPVIAKKVKREDDEAAVLVEFEEPSKDAEYAVRNGVSHGYWKDLLNILVLAATQQFDALPDPKDVLLAKNSRPANLLKDSTKALSPDEYAAKHKQAAKDRKHELERSRHENAVKMLQHDLFYCSLHLTVAKIFQEQLKKDMELLKSGKREDLGKISLAAKWAPSSRGFHDKHTFVASSIAEALYPRSCFAEIEEPREMYLRRARESLQRLTLAPLRKALEVVERDISAETFHKINYSKVPSVAMDNYKGLFMRKDLDQFEKYVDKVAAGKAHISGAVLTPAALVHQARMSGMISDSNALDRVPEAKQLLKSKIAQIEGKVLTGQWDALVKRIKDNGKLSSSIAVCDVSGSMFGPQLSDKTVPLDSSVGLALLLAEITDPPFGGHFITFSANPQVLAAGGPHDKRSLEQKVRHIMQSDWGMNTDFTAVFERLILPAAIKHQLKQEDMVKQVFVFSDMQFDAAQRFGPQFETDFERITRKYAEAGYEVPKLIFWNLAGGAGRGAPKPVTQGAENTMLVSGYSQGLLKMFLEDGQFDADVEVEDVVDEEMTDGADESGGAEEEDALVEVTTKLRKVDPKAGLRKAIGRKAYDMLKVVD